MDGGALGGAGGHAKGVWSGVYRGSSPWAPHHTVAAATMAAVIAVTLGGVHTGESAEVSALPYGFGSRGPEAEKEPYGSGSFRTVA